MTTESNNLDPDLVRLGDSRNVTDDYKTWTVAAIKRDLAKKSFPLHVAIENYQHDYNIGTIVRSANAFNVAGVHIIGKRHWNRRGAMATEKYLELFHHPDVTTFEQWSKANDLPVIGIDNLPGSSFINDYSLPEAAVYVFGQEGPGLSVEMQTICRDIVAIKQFGSTRSINLGVAAGIILYEWTRQHTVTY